MALLVSSRLCASSNIFIATLSFKSKPSSCWSSALIYLVKSSPASHGTHSLVLSSPPGKSIVLETTSKSSAKAAWQPPKYVYPDPNPEFAKVEIKKFQVELMKRLLKNKETFGNDIEEVVSVCSEGIICDEVSGTTGSPHKFLVRWKAQPPTEDTWMIVDDLEKLAPGLVEEYLDFNFFGKSSSEPVEFDA